MRPHPAGWVLLAGAYGNGVVAALNVDSAPGRLAMAVGTCWAVAAVVVWALQRASSEGQEPQP